jgi:site-specific recombinase XerD
MQTIQAIITTIISIIQSIRSLFSFFHKKKIEKENIVNQQKEIIKIEKTIDELIKNKEVDKLNKEFGWED